jgi:hypothetical protein
MPDGAPGKQDKGDPQREEDDDLIHAFFPDPR